MRHTRFSKRNTAAGFTLLETMIALIVALIAALLLKKPDHLEGGGAH